MTSLFSVISIGLLATLTMTAFSYGLSYFIPSNLKEPQLINLFIERIPAQPMKIGKEHIVGWVIHVLIGVFLVVIFNVCKLLFNIPISMISGIIFGSIAGVIGCCCWQLGFIIHPHPPSVNRATYYLHLLLAHIIFGITMTLLM